MRSRYPVRLLSDSSYIAVPSLFLTSLDDPISNKEVIPFYEFNSNPHCIFASTAKGGHLGWFYASWDNIFPSKRWFAKPCAEFMHAIVESTLSLPIEQTEKKEIAGHTGTIWQTLPKSALEARLKFKAGLDLAKTIDDTQSLLPSTSSRLQALKSTMVLP